MVMVGGTIDLECQVAFTSESEIKIRWKINGKLTDDAENQTEEIKNGEVFVEDHQCLVNILMVNMVLVLRLSFGFLVQIKIFPNKFERSN